MNVCRRCHSGLEDCLHILCRVFFACSYRKRTDLSNPLAARWPPASVRYRQKPNFSQRLDYGPAWALRRFCRSATGICVKVPKSLRRSQLSHRLVRDNPAPHLACPLADWLANLRGCLVALREHCRRENSYRQCKPTPHRELHWTHTYLSLQGILPMSRAMVRSSASVIASVLASQLSLRRAIRRNRISLLGYNVR